MNPFAVLDSVQSEYLTYVRTFQRFQNPQIRDWVMERVERGTLLWKPPYVQLSRPFLPGETLPALVDKGVLHPGTLAVFRSDPDDPASPPIHPYRHQTDAIRAVSRGANTIVATGTGSGKSFAFGIPIVSEALHMRAGGIAGIKAVIVYPMNALANSQYDDFAGRLHGSGLTIARYTGDTATSPDEALDRYRAATGRKAPYDSEVLSREEIQAHPPDILMTNYVMLELLLTRFEDRKLFAQPGVLRFLVLDEVHTFAGQRGADVAALIRRLKQHTDTVHKLRCIATSATVESPGEAAQSASEAVADFVQRLFGEPFAAGDVITESYAPLHPEPVEGTRPDGSTGSPHRPVEGQALTYAIAHALEAGPKTLPQLAAELDVSTDALQSALLAPLTSGREPAGRPVPKLHAFFSQGRAITACLSLDGQGPHLNDRGESVCPVCDDAGRPDRPTFPLVFCRACGQEFWSVAVDQEGRLHPADLDAVDVPGRLGYLLAGQPEMALPEHWLTPTGKIRGGKRGYIDVVPEEHTVCPDCGKLDSHCDHAQHAVTLLPAPFLFCPTCGIIHDRRSREYNKLFIFGSVGRSTATDVLVSAQVQALPAASKVIAFSDNRQDTALQAAHMQSLHNRFTFRRTLYTALQKGGYRVGQREGAMLENVGGLLYEAQKRHGVVPDFQTTQRIFGRDRQAEDRYQRYLTFVTLRELGATHRRTHQNLEDVGLLTVDYHGLDECAEASDFWANVPPMAALDRDARYDVLLGLMDILRKRLAIRHAAILEPYKFDHDVISKLSEDAYVHDDTFRGPIGYSDTADKSYRYTLFRLTGTNTQPVVWVKRAFEALDAPLAHADAVTLVTQIVDRLGDPRAEFLVQQRVATGYRRRRFELWMANPAVITLQADAGAEGWRCPKCGAVHHFRTLRVCTGSACRVTLERRDLSHNYFRQVYATPLDQAVPVHAQEHSGQVPGKERRALEIRFRDPDDPLNVLVCTPTMELGIDIGHLNAVMLRNVPPSPSNYAQRAGRAGRSGQPSLITVFAGVGAARGPHDQYFYRFPEKMIAGAIAAPRFQLDNQALITAHIHALVLETMGLREVEKLYSQPQQLLNLDDPNYPLQADWRAAYQAGVQRYFDAIVTAIEQAFADEMRRFGWLDRPFIIAKVRDFVDDLDRALERWRIEYRRLDAELAVLNRILGREGVDYNLDRRRVVIESKLAAMRDGKRDWYLYRYLGGEGFLPGYAFPPQATVLSFDDREDELARDPAIALTEYAPGNFVYYRGQRYEITHARPRSRRTEGGETPEVELDVELVLICPDCQRAYLGQKETNRARCACGADLITLHARQGLALNDMYAQNRARITADEEERMRLGYELTSHYRSGGQARAYHVRADGVDGVEALGLTLEHDGEVLLVNQGQREKEGEPLGFALCRKCHKWLVGRDTVLEHVGTDQKQGQCSRNARQDDVVQGLWLIYRVHSDLALFEVPLPAYVAELEQETAIESFYVTLLHTVLRALMVAFNLDEREVGGFLAPFPAGGTDAPYRLVIYETAVGGSGVLAALAEPGRLGALLDNARQLLHGEDDEAGCAKACYECLLSFYNQRDHEWLDRTLVLPWLRSLGALELELRVPEDRWAALEAGCQSEFERQVLRAIRARGLSLPDAAQQTLYDGDAPVAIADFYYDPKIVIFVDGSPHYRDYIAAADATKRKRLKARGYRVLAIAGDQVDEGLDTLAQWLGVQSMRYKNTEQCGTS
jgi:very-short-patch-repair endonuclease